MQTVPLQYPLPPGHIAAKRGKGEAGDDHTQFLQGIWDAAAIEVQETCEERLPCICEVQEAHGQKGAGSDSQQLSYDRRDIGYIEQY